MTEHKELNSHPSQPYYEAEEITLKELILKIQDFKREVWKNWKIILITAVILGTLMLLKAWFIPVTYEAKLTFMLNDDEGGGGGGAAAFLGQFGFVGGSKGEVNINKMIELSKSRKIIGMVLFEKVIIGEREDFVANHIIKEYDFHKRWEGIENLNDFLFQHGNITYFDKVENSAFKSVHKFLIGDENQILKLSSNELSGISTLTITTSNEELSLNISEICFQNLQNYYVEKTINKQKATYELLLNRTDSIRQELDKNQLASLKFEDKNRNLGLRQYQIERLRLEGEIQKLFAVYQESFKQLTIAEFNLQNKTPFITTIDAPIFPLKKSKESLIKAAVMGIIIGLSLTVGFVFVRKILRDAMSENA